MSTEYPVFTKWMSVLDWILDRSEKLPKSVRFSIATRMANHAMDVMEDIVEAIYTKDRQHILDRINIYIEKLRIIFRVCHVRRYVSTPQYEFISRELNETGRMIGGWRRSLG